jgi:glucose-fructose oxidoreductase
MTGYSWNANNFRAYGDRGQIDAEPATGYGGHNFRKNGQPIKVEPANMWAAQMDHLSDCINDSTKTLIAPGEMGWRDIRIIEAVLASADTGKSIKFQ